MTILSLFSISDMLVICTKKQSIAFKITKNLGTRLGNRKRIKDKFMLTSFQKQFCELIYGLEQKRRFIYVFGKAYKGKTTAIIYLLKDMVSNSSTWDEMPWPNNLYFIDCTGKKEDILDFFLTNESINTRINKFSGKIIIVDNIECMGDKFFEDNIGLFSSHKSLFIIIEDTVTKQKIKDDALLSNALHVSDFDKNIFNVRQNVNLFNQLLKLTHVDRTVFFSLYFLTLSSAFAKKDDICKSLGIRNRKLSKSLSAIKATNLFINFPFNENYYYCLSKIDIKNTEEIFTNDLAYNETLQKLFNTRSIDGECRWRCLVKCNIALIKDVDENERMKLFSVAVKNCNYNSLFDELETAISIAPEKSELFLFERAVLSFNTGNHKKAVEYYTVLLSVQRTRERRKELMLRIIESNHGNPNDNNMEMIEDWIVSLQEDGDIHALYAKYWDCHIKTEKGIFPVDEFRSLRLSLNDIKAQKHVINAIKNRCYTDEIRCLHLLGETLPLSLCEEYKSFLLEYKGNTRYEYFYNLYVEANTIHYVDMLELLIADGIDYDAYDMKIKAEFYYDRALGSLYKSEKSLRATRIKKLEVGMFAIDFDFDDALNQINLFLIHSQINFVTVHEAFCHTLLMKVHLIAPINFNNIDGFMISEGAKNKIENHYLKGRATYSAYGNEYGVFRLDFLYKLYIILTANPEQYDECFATLYDFTCTVVNYPKEKKIMHALQKRRQQNNLPKLYLSNIIRFYPIILQ